MNDTGRPGHGPTLRPLTPGAWRAALKEIRRMHAPPEALPHGLDLERLCDTLALMADLPWIDCCAVWQGLATLTVDEDGHPTVTWGEETAPYG